MVEPQKYADIVVDHELPGVRAEMIDWWWMNMVDTRFYILWHPWDHFWIKWEVPPTEEMTANKNIGAIHIANEKIGNSPVRNIHVQIIDPAENPIKPTYSHQRAVKVPSDTEGKLVGWIRHEYEDAPPWGVRFRSTFRYPPMSNEETAALIKHNKEEIGQFTVFLPELYKLGMIWEGVNRK